MDHSKCRAILYSGDIEANSKDLYKCHAILFFLLLLKQADTQMGGNGKTAAEIPKKGAAVDNAVR